MSKVNLAINATINKSIRVLTDAFVAIAKEMNFPLYYNNEYGVGARIFGWLPYAQVVESSGPQGTINMLQKNTRQVELFKAALKLPLSQAIERMNLELKNGYFNKQSRRLVICLTDIKDFTPLQLICCHCDGKLQLNVYLAGGESLWLSGDGDVVGFLSNES